MSVMPLSSIPAGARSRNDGDRVTPVYPEGEPPRESEVRQRCASLLPVSIAPMPSVSEESPLERARRLHIEGEFDRALLLATAVLDREPGHHEATKISGACRRALERECLEAMGGGDVVLRPAVTAQESKRFPLDSTSAFLLSLIDGATRVEELLDISGMPRLFALRQLRDLLEKGIVDTVAASRAARHP
jgi:hypothetical protein